jgi:hypothetical protein
MGHRLQDEGAQLGREPWQLGGSETAQRFRSGDTV